MVENQTEISIKESLISLLEEFFVQDASLATAMLGIGTYSGEDGEIFFEVKISHTVKPEILALLPRNHRGIPVKYEMMEITQETTRPNVLNKEHTPLNVTYYSDGMPIGADTKAKDYVVVNGTRHWIDELNEADLEILHKLFPDGPQVLR